MCPLAWVAYFLSSVGAINWGLVKFFKFNLVEYFTRMVKVKYLNEAIYGLVAISGFYALISLFLSCS